MPEIQVLDQRTIDKIAAGEVVEKPHSVVKELVENSIDALAGSITIEIKDGGTSLIRITDNGCGIEKSQIELAFLRHSTSKIRKVEDLLMISSLGFRGEALSSISAVAQVELITKTPESFVGSRFEIHGGKKIAFEEVGAPDGTTIIVRNLFYNTPARKKFLKTAATEGNYIQSLVERLALSHPEISFKFINNNQIKLQTSGNGSLKDVIYQIYGRDIASNLIEISVDTEEASLKGFIGKPVISRGNRQYENYFVNSRYVRSNIISKAIEQAYKNFLMQHKYPFTVLLSSFDGKSLDVNVHPAKMEIRFSKEEKVFEFFYRAVFDALSKKELISNVSLDNKNIQSVNKTEEKTKIKPPEPFEKHRIQMEQEQSKAAEKREKNQTDNKIKITGVDNEKKDNEKTDSQLTGLEKPLLDKNNEEKIVSYGNNNNITDNNENNLIRERDAYGSEIKQLSFFEEKLTEKSVKDEIKILGQVFDTYWILEYQDSMYIIDQHAAHEKVLYERTLKLLENKTFTSQMLNPPLIITVSSGEAQILKEYKEQFQQIGFEIEPFEGKEYAIRAIPGNLYGLNERELFIEMLDDLSENITNQTPEMVLDKIASMSCKAAVKGNMKLSCQEARELLLELMELDNPYHCPHGRPVIVSVTKKEIEKKFKRIL